MEEQYKNILTDLIKKQMIMLGPSVALGTAKKNGTLTIGEDGTVSGITGDPKAAMSGLAQAYMVLSGQIAQSALNSILEKYPDIKGKVAP